MIDEDRVRSQIEALAAMRGLGMVSARMLVEAGVGGVEDLRRLGVIDAYRRLRFRHGKRVTLNFVYALECALLDIDWRLLSGERKAALKVEARAVDAEMAAAATGRGRR